MSDTKKTTKKKTTRKRTATKKKTTKAAPRADAGPVAIKQDGWSNFLTGAGNMYRDKRTAWTIDPAYHIDEVSLTNLFHGNDLAQRICRLPAVEMIREWITVQSDSLDDAQISALMGALDALGAQNALIEALTTARLMGNGLLFVGADDGQDPRFPLNEDRIKSINFITVLDRYEVHIEQWNEDPLQQEFGEPILYRIATSTSGGAASRSGALVHASRMIKFAGNATSRRRIRNNGGWHDSIFTRILSVLRGYDSAWASTEALLQDFSQAVFKMKDLTEIMATSGEAEVMKRLELVDASRSTIRALLIDADMEEFERKVTPIAGLSDILQRFATRVSAAAGMPTTLLFGQSSTGLNATGEGEERQWANAVKASQEEFLRKGLERLITLVMRASEGPLGQEPDVWHMDFNSLFQLSPLEESQRRNLIAQTDKAYIENDVLLPSEVAISRFGGEGFSDSTVIDIELREELSEAEAEEALNPPEPPQLPTPGGFNEQGQEGGVDNEG